MFFCFFNDTATTEIYTYGHTLSLHYALPICKAGQFPARSPRLRGVTHQVASAASIAASISAIRNGWPETLLSGFASTRNWSRSTVFNWPVFISGTRTRHIEIAPCREKVWQYV